ncbi:MAG: flagellar export protein FliJ [Planctomycetes bacterium]|nr:flagellar export protein FliJ [Planctomycetota bacterium]
MKKFKFKLRSALNYKTIVEAQKQKAYAEAQAKVIEVENKIEYNNREIQGSKNTLVELAQDDLHVKEILSHHRYINSLNASNRKLNEELVPLKKVAEKRRLELIEASKEKKALEKLEESQKATWQEEFDRWEQKQLDEIGLNSKMKEIGRRREEEAEDSGKEDRDA